VEPRELRTDRLAAGRSEYGRGGVGRRGAVYRRSATGGGDAKDLRHDGIPTVEFGFGTDTAHAVDEHTTVDALVRNAEAYSQLVGEYAARIDAGRSSEP
jgi:succinyl-diaminopimelate desuccinylase